MQSEKLIYWTTLGVLALAAATGFVTEHRGWRNGLAERSIEMVSQASQSAANYVEVAGLALRHGEEEMTDSPRVVVDIPNDLESNLQTNLACVRTMARHQAEFGRLQAMKLRMRALNRVPRTIVLRNQNMVIQVPQVAEIPED